MNTKMIFKQLYSQNELKVKENMNYNKVRSLDIPNPSEITDKQTEDYFISRLQELEEMNARLEILVEKQKRELAEIIASNTKFLSIIAHDLRGPFSSILGALELLKGSLDENHIKDSDRYINLASNSAKRTLILVENLMEWALTQNKEKSFNPVKIYLFELLEEEIADSHALALRKTIKVNQYVAPDLCISADLQMTKTIFRNLISNAIKFTHNYGEISITASEEGQFVQIKVKDNGIGISYKAQTNLFKMDAFHSTTGTNHEAGTGLGLLICKEFVEIHGGTIRLVSEPGKGSSFIIALPHYI
jgi:two-component system, sensor histidine kinase and response regulator